MKVSITSGLIIGLFVVGMLPLAGYFGIYGRLPFAGFDSVPVVLESASAKTLVIDLKGKIQSPVSLQEYVVIGDQRFEVSPPWLGHRIEGETDPEKLEFAMLPLDLVLERREIYVISSARDAFVKMANAAALDGVELVVDSGYRSAAYQRRIYQRKMGEGDDFYDIARGVAPPGYSEHMLGTTLDLVPSKWTFHGTPAEKWLLENGGDFAFVQSYPQRSDRGFTWEPWHWKYVGDS